MFSLSGLALHAQKKGKLTFETIYRPVYGYLIDSLTNTPFQNVVVYAFDSIEDARKGEEALMKSRNPMTLKLKGDVVETRTDESGRYMVPARNTGALIFHFKERKEIVVEEIADRSEISRGRKVVKAEYDFDISEYLGKDYRREPGKVQKKGPEGVVLDMNFKAYIPQPGDKGKESRVVVERRIIDMETGEVLSTAVPVVRDGKTFHKQRKKLIAKGLVSDDLYDIADGHPVLTDSTSSIRIIDHMDTEPWKERPFRLGYYVSMEHDGQVKQIDTLYMMSNRINTPLKYLEYEFDPYGWEVEETTEQRRAVTRRLVLEGEYDGNVPEVLKDSSYVLRELHIKAMVAQNREYGECIALADSMVAGVMDELRVAFADKINDQVRITKTSQVSPDTSFINNVSYRYIFSTGRQFSRNEYLLQIKRAKEEARIERLCRQAMEERQILDGTSWDYAANVLASLYLRQGKTDLSLLAPFIDRSLQECDIKTEDPVTYEETVMNRREIVANQVLMLLRMEDFSGAADLAGMLPEDYAQLRQIAICKNGATPSDEISRNLVRQSSPRNNVLMDMLTEKVSDSTLEVLKGMPEEDAMTWYLRARAYCTIYENESWEMQNATLKHSQTAGSSQLVLGQSVGSGQTSGSSQTSGSGQVSLGTSVGSGEASLGSSPGSGEASLGSSAGSGETSGTSQVSLDPSVGSGQTVYEYVTDCLRKCFAIDPSLIPTAKFDSEINEYALKEVLGVYVL